MSDSTASEQHLWRLGSKLLDCSRPCVMAIVNATPDSFYAGSRLGGDFRTLSPLLDALLADPPDIVDVGGQSSRPGSLRVDSAEELRRVLPVIQRLRKHDAAQLITVDTYSAEVAREALAAGADGVNDISACRFDPALFDVVAGSGCGYVLMHMQGTPETMQQAPHYDDCAAEVAAFLASNLVKFAERGIARERIVLDPGVGFGKRVEDNLVLIQGAARFSSLGRPLLYGISRKAFIGRLAYPADADGHADERSADPALRLPGTLGLTWELLGSGVMLHRVHDAAEARQVARLWQALRGS